MKSQHYQIYKNSETEWLEQIPEHWQEKRIKDLSFLQSGINITSDQIEEEEKYPVYGGNGLRGYFPQYTNEGEYVLIGRQGALCGNINYASGKFWATEHAVVVYLKPNIDWKWYGEMLRVMNLNQYSVSAAQPGLSVDRIKRLLLPVPPFLEQEAIAHYLDTKTAQIDRKIDLLTQKAQRYEELKRAIVNETVTRGLDKSVPMKDSAIEWIGEIPEHWEIFPIRTVIENRIEKNTENTEDEYLSLVAGIGVIPYAEKGNVGNKKPENLEKCKMVYPGDFVLNSMNFGIGSFGISRFKGVCSSVYIVMKPKCIKSGEFLYRIFQIKPFQIYISSFGKGIMEIRMAIKWSDLKNIHIPVPPLSEQQAIARYLDTKTAQIDQIIQTINTQIEKLKELRKTLINDVVTGKIKVA